MRIGTWNLQGRWDQRHIDHIESMDCDLLLLTEVPERARLTGMEIHPSRAQMAPRRYWAAVASRRPLVAMPDPHGASAMVEIGHLRVCSSILPWRSCGTRPPWTGSNTAAKTEAAVENILACAPAVWGGDWNHAMTGREYTGSLQGRSSIRSAVVQLRLQLPTVDAPHQIGGLLSIDHIAVPDTWDVREVEHHPATSEGAHVSDHDAYVVQID